MSSERINVKVSINSLNCRNIKSYKLSIRNCFQQMFKNSNCPNHRSTTTRMHSVTINVTILAAIERLL